LVSKKYKQLRLTAKMFGPLGLSFAPYVKSSRTLYKWIKPFATWYANLSGYRQMGLRYDDLRMYSRHSRCLLTTVGSTVVEERPDVQRVGEACVLSNEIAFN